MTALAPRSDPVARLQDAAQALAQAAAQAGEELHEAVAPHRDGSTLPALRDAAQAMTDAVHAATRAAAELNRRVAAQFDAWQASTRFGPERLAESRARLRGSSPAAAWRWWGGELAAALAQLRPGAALAVLAMAVDDGVAPAGLPDLTGDLIGWRDDGDLAAAAAAVTQLRAAGSAFPAGARRRLALTAAWLAAARGDRSTAADLLADELGAPADDRSARVGGSSGGPGGTGGQAAILGELAALRLQSGDLADAMETARHTVEDAPDEPSGHLVLGAAAEGAGDYGTAADLYARGCAGLSATGLLALGQGATFLQPTGMLQLQRARSLAGLGLDTEALSAVEAALGLGLAGVVPHPDADAHALRARLLERSGASPAACATAALEGGRRYLFNGQLDAAVELLGRATRPDVLLPEAGWILAEAMTVRACPQNAAVPDTGLLARARDHWDAWVQRAGAPTGTLSWAYLTRAVIESAIPRPATAAQRWRALVLAERCIVGDPGNARGWAWSASMLRELKLLTLASESVDAGFALDPDDDMILAVRFTLMADAGRYGDALKTLDRMPRDASSAAWHAWLLIHVGQADEAARQLDEPIALGIELDQNLVVRALCHASAGRFADALSDLRRVLTVADNDQSSRFRRAYAHAALGEADAAERELAQAAGRRDESVASCYALAVAACVHFAGGAVDRAAAEIDEALGSALTVADADNAIINCTQMLRLLEYRGADVQAGRQALARAQQAHPQVPPAHAADDEYGRCAAAHHQEPAGSAPLLALGAIRARRLAQAGELAAAADAYELLRGGPFEPQAAAGLASVLSRQFLDAIARGQVDAVPPLFGRLTELGARPCPLPEQAVAEAQAAAGRPDEALATLRGAAAQNADALDGPGRTAIQSRIASLALLAGEPGVAAEAFLTAASTAATLTGPGQPEPAALTIGAGVSLAAGGDRDGATRCFDEAARLLAEAGALSPAAVVAREARTVAAWPSPFAAWLPAAVDQVLAAPQHPVELPQHRPASRAAPPPMIVEDFHHSDNENPPSYT